MKKILCLAILSLFSINTSLWAQTDTLPNDLGKKVISAEGLKNVIESEDSRFVIVDVRPKSAYDMGHIPTAVNIPSGLVSDVENPPPTDKYIILYCFGGLTSPAAGEKMIANGYKHILVWGGINSWPYELEKSK